MKERFNLSFINRISESIISFDKSISNTLELPNHLPVHGKMQTKKLQQIKVCPSVLISSSKRLVLSAIIHSPIKLGDSFVQ